MNETNEVEIVSYTYNPVYNRIFDESVVNKISNYVISIEIELDETKEGRKLNLIPRRFLNLSEALHHYIT